MTGTKTQVGEIKQVIDKSLALSNLYYFNKYVLDYLQMEIKPHLELCDFIQNWGKKQRKLILLPRGSYKSSMATVGYPLWLMAQPENSPYTLPSLKGKGGNRNIRVLIDGEERTKVPQEKLYEIKGKIGSYKFSSLFGKLEPDPRERPWRDDLIFIRTRDKAIWGVPTVVTGGIDTVVTGMHFDLIIADDLCGETNTNTDDQLEKVRKHVGYYTTLLDPLGCLIIIGTLWHYKDVYHYILNNDDIRESYQIIKRPAHNEDGTLLFPEILGEERLRFFKSQLRSDYYPQYELEVTAAEEALVTKNEIKYYQIRGEEIWIEEGGKWVPKEITIKDLTKTTTCDEAHTKEKYADWTAVVTKGEDKDGNWYILEAKRGRWLESETLLELQLTYQTWKPLFLGLESDRFELLAKNLDRQFIYPKELKHRGRSKFDRFRQLQPRFARGKIYLLQDQVDLETEILQWTRTGFKGEHDDLSDALSYQIDLGTFENRERKPLYIGGYKPITEVW